MKREEKETFLGTRPSTFKPFEYLIADQLLTDMPDEKRIKKLKEVFILAVRIDNDEAAVKLLKLINKAYQEKEIAIAKGPQGNGHLGRAGQRAIYQFRDWLKEIYWQLPDMKSERQASRPVMRPTMLQTKLWILEQIIDSWEPKSRYYLRKATRDPAEESLEAFRFLIAAFVPFSKNYQPRPGESKFEIKARGRKVSEEERNKILELLRNQNVVFTPEELEEWLKQPQLPFDFERTLAIARTRKGGAELWRADIRNAQLVKPLSPDGRTEAALDLHNQHCQLIAGVDQKVQELIAQMHTGSFGRAEEIGASEYVLGEIKLGYQNLFEFKISVEVAAEHPEGLVRDNFGRAKRHIQKWLQENRSHRVGLHMEGGKTKLVLEDGLYGDHHFIFKKG